MLYDRDGAVRGLVQREFRQIYPTPGWVEHDPEEKRGSLNHVLRESHKTWHGVSCINLIGIRGRIAWGSARS
jgi:glycerol kinase